MENKFKIMPNRVRIIFKLFLFDLKPVVQTEVKAGRSPHMMFSHFRWQKMANKPIIFKEIRVRICIKEVVDIHVIILFILMFINW